MDGDKPEWEGMYGVVQCDPALPGASQEEGRAYVCERGVCAARHPRRRVERVAQWIERIHATREAKRSKVVCVCVCTCVCVCMRGGGNTYEKYSLRERCVPTFR